MQVICLLSLKYILIFYIFDFFKETYSKEFCLKCDFELRVV